MIRNALKWLESIPYSKEIAADVLDIITSFNQDEDFVKELIEQDFYLCLLKDVLEEEDDSKNLRSVTLITAQLSCEREHVSVLGRHNIYRELSNRIIKSQVGLIDAGVYNLMLEVLANATEICRDLPKSSADYLFEDNQGGNLIARYH